ncbi:MAG: LysM peptidoglycan-binding domain-containing M23 family metallopeptidase [Anaerolineales bacterium]
MSHKHTSDHNDRSDELFRRLAAEEPPLDTDNDTAPSSTAPHEAIDANGHTRPVQAQRGNTEGRFLITLTLGVLLVVSLIITVLVFMNSDETPNDDNEDPIIAQQATPTTPPTQTAIPPTTIPTEESPTEPDEPDEPDGPNERVEPFIVDITPLPTAAADEVGSALLTPVVPVTLIEGASVLRQDNAFTVTGSTGRLDVVPYTVERGDTLSGLAARFNLDICSIVWSNPRNRVSPLRPGNVLDIMPVDGVLFRVTRNTSIEQIAADTGVDPYTIIDSPFNDLSTQTPETVLVEGMKIVVPGGDGGNCNVWSPPPGSGATASSGGGGGLWGCNAGGGGGGFPTVNPVGGRYSFTQGFTPAHTGVDLAGAAGTPILASGAGVVSFAGWTEYGYGNAIVISHGSTYTLYAHLNAINVTCGQAVGAGEVIGAMGSTGRSSGNHLHFEIRDAGFNPIDPTFTLPF